MQTAPTVRCEASRTRYASPSSKTATISSALTRTLRNQPQRRLVEVDEAKVTCDDWPQIAFALCQMQGLEMLALVPKIIITHFITCGVCVGALVALTR